MSFALLVAISLSVGLIFLAIRAFAEASALLTKAVKLYVFYSVSGPWPGGAFLDKAEEIIKLLAIGNIILAIGARWS